jgi:hypothetical protein
MLPQFTLLFTPRFRGRGQLMNTHSYPNNRRTLSFKSIGVSMCKSRISVQRGSNNHKRLKSNRNCLYV